MRALYCLFVPGEHVYCGLVSRGIHNFVHVIVVHAKKMGRSRPLFYCARTITCSNKIRMAHVTNSYCGSGGVITYNV